MHLVSCGQMEVTTNGEMGKFFHNKRGLCQGDPSLPLIFNYVVDAFSAMLDKARADGHIEGLVPHLIPGGVTQLQYADNTTLLFEPDLHSIASIKLLLITFELLFGLKINFLKSEVITIGMGQQESRHADNLLNCKLGGFPIKYLGLPTSHRKL
uniref:Reverse transcriptase domain-containing protein n=1 Tax=Triticum urartu TaxID=4572 RepID=A0A8R7PUA3_TRIUA